MIPLVLQQYTCINNKKCKQAYKIVYSTYVHIAKFTQNLVTTVGNNLVMCIRSVVIYNALA